VNFAWLVQSPEIDLAVPSRHRKEVEVRRLPNLAMVNGKYVAGIAIESRSSFNRQ